VEEKESVVGTSLRYIDRITVSTTILSATPYPATLCPRHFVRSPVSLLLRLQISSLRGPRRPKGWTAPNYIINL